MPHRRVYLLRNEVQRVHRFVQKEADVRFVEGGQIYVLRSHGLVNASNGVQSAFD